jgi:hypothetical protein
MNGERSTSDTLAWDTLTERRDRAATENRLVERILELLSKVPATDRPELSQVAATAIVLFAETQ